MAEAVFHQETQGDSLRSQRRSALISPLTEEVSPKLSPHRGGVGEISVVVLAGDAPRCHSDAVCRPRVRRQPEPSGTNSMGRRPRGQEGRLGLSTMSGSSSIR
ncbi:hypothetical protein NHX12_030834 [Muraenolepis orangiensis]|uniref:Uncharacterized protein n=1 Tax=Muraenolepis orangiensis TaxID=630683 RepID=A0A9Q0E9E8_9TELE|nr:hypothetical protein NHX12_030834 [Muraenolepis orangiensis]